jgi:hypothetical protein
VYERGETYVHRINVWDKTKTKVNPSKVSFSLYDPCSCTIVNNATMTGDATGDFHYYHNLSTSATYGRYTAQVKLTSASSEIEYIRTEFFIMPWDVVPEVRDTMGIPEQKSVTDDVIARTVWNCYTYTLHDLYTYVKDEYPNGNVTTGAGFDGTNTEFKTKQYPIADINGDGRVVGSLLSCATDITGHWVDINGHYHTAYVWVTNAEYGEIYIYQTTGGLPIPSTNQGCWVDYWIRPRHMAVVDGWVTQDLLRAAVVRLTCYELSKRMQSLDAITLADIKSNSPIITLDPQMYYKEYKRYLGMCRGPVSGGV